MSARQTYLITERAGPYIAGYRRPSGTTILLTPEEAEYDLRVGTIEPTDPAPPPPTPTHLLLEAGDFLRTLRGSSERNIEVEALEGFLVRERGEVAAYLAVRADEIANAIAAIVEARLGSMVSRNSPELLGTPTAPTAAAGVSSGQIATTAFVRAALTALVDSSPAALDTLKELATALGNDPNFAASMATALGNRLRVDAAQGFTSAQIVQALTNLGVSSFIRTVLDDADAATLRRSLELGSAALQAASAFAAALHGHPISDITNLQGSLDAKAPLASPAFTGAPTAPTAAVGSSTQQLATTAFVAAALATLVDSSPAALDTLKELATALGNDPNFAASMATALGNRLRVDAAQGLTSAQIVQALTNLGVSSFVRTVLDDADASAARATLGVREVIRGNSGPGNIPAGATRYIGISLLGVNPNDVWFAAGRKGRLSNLRVITQGAAGDGQSWTFTVQKLFADTALTCSIAGTGGNVGADLTRSVDFEPNDRLSLKVVSSGGAPATSAVAFTVDFQAID